MESSTTVASITVLLHPVLKRHIGRGMRWIGEASEVICGLGPSFARYVAKVAKTTVNIGGRLLGRRWVY
jgi:hypothetical protein